MAIIRNFQILKNFKIFQKGLENGRGKERTTKMASVAKETRICGHAQDSLGRSWSYQVILVDK